MRAEIISIGDELTTGQRLDTNSQWLSERLLEIGVEVAFHTTVGDNVADNVLAFRQAVERADVILATGGLGPTADDLTRQAIAEVAGVQLVQDEASLAHIKALFARRKREMPPANLVQALFPQGSRPLPNPHGTAPGIDCSIARRDRGPARIFALPGVPAEMQEMWAASVGPAIQELLGQRRVIAHHRIKCFGVGESDLEAMLPDLIARQRYPLVGITVHQATITLRITAAAQTPELARAAMQPTIDTIHRCLGVLVFGEEDDELEDVVIRMLRERHLTLAVREWGTCGLVAHWLASARSAGVFQCASVFPGQQGWDDLAQRQPGDADYLLCIGPSPQPDSPTSAPGNLKIILAHAAGVMEKEFPFAGHPEILRPRAAKLALNLLRLHLLRAADSGTARP
ncbi:MAG: CinA family nicotinamide mononucleotide deamidase-related protein [Planctomycetaceae bacterium]|nr:CinA family nicotinamide mononucleotide deamidase-related protein [Planctomycetaceae bacterium]